MFLWVATSVPLGRYHPDLLHSFLGQASCLSLEKKQKAWPSKERNTASEKSGWLACFYSILR